MTRRDVKVALLAVCATLCLVAVVAEVPVQHSAVFEWNALVAKPNQVGAVRTVFRGPTATLEELEMHITTLNAGATSHAPHKHPNEELVIVKEGTVETLSNGVWKRLGPGSVIFNASNEEHALKNVGTTSATYHVINWKTSLTPKGDPQK